VSVPGIRFVHAESGVLGIEWIDGASVRKVLGGGAEGEEEEEESGDLSDEQVQEEDVDVLKETYGLTGGQFPNPLRQRVRLLMEQ
jgi:TP53 regulating kinase-like protein